MKKLVLLAAFAALVLSCTKKAEIDNMSNVRTVHFTASSVETKTVFGTPDGSTYPVLWSENDKQVGVSLNFGEVKEANVSVSADRKTATFSQDVAETGYYQFVVVNPLVAFKSVNSTENRIMVEIPSGQTCTATTPDERAQVMVGVSDYSLDFPEKVSLTLKHVPEYLHMVFTNVNLNGAKVQSVNISSDVNIAGRFYRKVSDGSFVEGPSMLKSISISPETLDNVWCAIAPVDLSGTNLTVSIVTDKGSLTKVLAIPSGKEFKSGKIFKMTVDMSGVTLSEPVVYELVTSSDELHWGDRIIVVAAEYDFALSTAQNGNNRSGTGVTKGDGTITDPSAAVEVIKLEDGVIPGTWSFVASGGENDGYLYAAAGYDNAGNYLRTQQDLDELGSWNISFGDFTDNDKAAPDAQRAIVKAIVPNRPLMRYNVESNLFSCYGETTSMFPIKLYRLSGAADDSPRFNVNMPSGGKTISSSANSLSVYVFGNVAWTASATGGATLDKTAGTGYDKLTLTIPENTSTEAKTITVTLSTSASVSTASYSFSITQNVKNTQAIPVGTLLFGETWVGGTAGQTPSAYLASEKGTTKVYGSADIEYTQKSSDTYIKTDGLVYVPSKYSGSLALPENMNNLLLAFGGWWKIAGIPCTGVKKATLTFNANYKAIPTAITSDTEGVTVGSLQQDDDGVLSQWGKNYYAKTYEITFDASFSGDSFSITFVNGHSKNNVRIADVELTVTEIQ